MEHFTEAEAIKYLLWAIGGLIGVVLTATLGSLRKEVNTSLKMISGSLVDIKKGLRRHDSKIAALETFATQSAMAARMHHGDSPPLVEFPMHGASVGGRRSTDDDEM